MATSKSVWGLDIGQCALKAIKLREVNGQLEAEAFDIVEHPKVLSEPDANREELINQSIEEFLSRNDVAGCRVAVSVPGQSSFTRFVKLPQVDAKRIPQLVGFEAEQQIPFDINEVIWRWQSFANADSPDIEVGLFAMKRTDVYSVLDPFTEMEVGVDAVQMAPLALYNFMTYDQQAADEGATLLVDIGANGTDLVVADGSRLWTRTVQLGGNNFTEALVKAFKLSFAKAEKLKRTAATSKYARQVFQAMRPVFSDLAQEIQRSIGYYTSLHRDARFSRIIGVGNGFRLPGLQKFLEQNLSTPVIRVDSLNALQPSDTINAPQFTENVPSFAVAYGLAVQGLELTKIDTNLLPDEIASSRRWAQKRPWFATAAALIIVATLGWAWREYNDNSILNPGSSGSEDLRTAQRINNTYKGLSSQMNQVKSQDQAQLDKMQEVLDYMKWRPYWPNIIGMFSQTVQKVATHQTKLVGTEAEALKNLGGENTRCLIMESLTSKFITPPETTDEAEKLLEADGTTNNNANAMGMGMGMGGGFGGGYVDATEGEDKALRLTLVGHTPLDRNQTISLLTQLIQESKRVTEDQLKGQATLMAVKIIKTAAGEDPEAAKTNTNAPGMGMGMAPGMGMGMGMAPGMGMGMAPGMGMGMGMRGGSSSLTSGIGAKVMELDKDLTGKAVAQHTTFEIAWILKINNGDEGEEEL